MSSATIKRNRAEEASERRRRERQDMGLCIDCPRPSKTRRCPDCNAKVEEASGRYHGQGRKGPPRKIDRDLVDLRHALEAISRAHAHFAEVARDSTIPTKRYSETLAEDLARLGLADRLVRGVVRRHRDPEEAASRRVNRRVPQLVFAFFASGAMGAR